MQRPTTSGRRHTRAGSVTVAELIRRQPTLLRIPSREQAATHGFEVDPAGEPTPPAARPPSNRAARFAGMATGVVVLLGAVTATAILAGKRPTGPDEPRVEAPAPISGSSALRPDLLSAELGGGRLDRAPVEPLAADVPPEVTVVVSPSALSTGSKPQVDVVRRFYELLPAKPAEAARLLSPELLGEGPGQFVAAWGQVQSITIESTALRPDGTVLAVVSMQERNGRWMRVEQVFRLTDTTVPRIVGTEVLSAQRS